MSNLQYNEYFYKSYLTSVRKLDEYRIRPLLLLFFGAIIGFINGFWGGGGGMISVPILSCFVNLNEKQSHATTILIMLPLSITSLTVYVFNNIFDWNMVLTGGIGFVVGGLAGAYLLQKITNSILKLVFSLIILISALWIIL